MVAARQHNRITCRPVEAPIVFGVSRATIYRWKSKGYIRMVERGGMTFLNVAEVEDFIMRGVNWLGDQVGDQTDRQNGKS